MTAKSILKGTGSRDINYLLEKYETKQPGEIENAVPYAKEIWRHKQKIRDADIAMKRLNIKGDTKQEVYDLLWEFEFSKLCKKCTYEQKIVALCLYVKFSNTKRRPLSDYAIVKEVGLTTEMFLTIVLKLSNKFRAERPIRHSSHVI